MTDHTLKLSRMRHDEEAMALWCVHIAWQLRRDCSLWRAVAGRPIFDSLEAILSEPRAAEVFTRDSTPCRGKGVVTRGRLPERVGALQAPPHGLWVHGDTGLLEPGLPRVAVIGSRLPRRESVQLTRSIAAGLARAGVVVVSGMAIGVDGVAHSATLEAGGKTITVWAAGLDRPYPARHRKLAAQILEEGGLVVSEYGPGLEPMPHRFRKRNRIIAALSDFVVVVQAKRQSGSMHTVEYAQEVGVDIGVVPSYVGDPAFEGSLALLRDGARAIVDAGSVLKAIGMEEPGASAQHGFGTLLDAPRTVDDVANLSGLGLGDTLEQLLELELSGLVERMPDGRYVNAMICAVQ